MSDDYERKGPDIRTLIGCTCTCMLTVFGGANFHEKSDKAPRINGRYYELRNMSKNNTRTHARFRFMSGWRASCIAAVHWL